MTQASESDLRPFLPCLVRMSLITPLDSSDECKLARRSVSLILCGIEVVNSIVGLLSVDFPTLEPDLKKEHSLRLKQGVQIEETVQNFVLEFERSEAKRKFRLVLSEIFSVVAKKETSRDFEIKNVQLFATESFMEEVSDVLCVAMAELPNLLPLTDVVDALMQIENGDWFIERIVANMPDMLLEVCNYLIDGGEANEEESLSGRTRLGVLKRLAALDPKMSLCLRSKCVEVLKMPAFAIHLTLMYNRDEIVYFLLGLLLGTIKAARDWMSAYIRTSEKKVENLRVFHHLREELLEKCKQLSAGGKIDSINALKGVSLLRLYCAFKCIAGMKQFSEKECAVIPSLIVSRPPPTPAGVTFSTVGLSTLLACPSLVTSDWEVQIIQHARWLLREVKYFGEKSVIEVLILLAIYFHANQLSAITDFVSNALGMKITTRTSTLARIRTLFTQDILPEQVITSHATKIPVTAGLNATLTSHLPVNCIYQLLKSRSFTKHRVSIKPWIYKQILSCHMPLHPTVPALIEQYISSMLTLVNKPGVPPLEVVNEPLDEKEISAVLTSDRSSIARKDDITPQLLLLYYLLYYEDLRLQNVKAHLQLGLKVKAYSRAFVLDLPIKYLVLVAEKNQHLYSGLFPTLLRLLTSQFPQLCIVEDWLSNSSNLFLEIPTVSTGCNGANIRKAFGTLPNSSDRLTRILKRLAQASVDQLWTQSSVLVENIKKLLDPGVPTSVQMMYKEVWFRIALTHSCDFWVMTTNALRQESGWIGRGLTEYEITTDPLIVLRCDSRVFRCPPLLSILLHLLRVWLASSRSFLQRHQLERPLLEKVGNLTSENERDDLRNAYIAAHESVVVQILLEACLPLESDKETDSNLSELQEVRSIICSFLHQMFIADPGLCKLVHFQGYPLDLISVAVEGIPSMHICLDFIPELLAQPNLEKQVFGINLMSHLCIQYALPKSYSMARLSINVLATLIPILQANQRRQLIEPALPSLVRIGSVFPTLREDIADIYVQIGQITISELSISNSLKFHPQKPYTVKNIEPKDKSETAEQKINIKQEVMEVEEGEIDEDVAVKKLDPEVVPDSRKKYKKRKMIVLNDESSIVPLEQLTVNELYSFLIKQRESFALFAEEAILQESS
ncbi:integrator complex subunit 2-like isoform X2 [Artemia franciscana]|uniref:integrator complex subunit 2-like isoform X2 n=1 Tax=Artemia franciscana TaxID=6661 RepID=UPI0032D9F157